MPLEQIWNDLEGETERVLQEFENAENDQDDEIWALECEVEELKERVEMRDSYIEELENKIEDLQALVQRFDKELERLRCE